MDKAHNITVGLDGTFKPQGGFNTNSTIADADLLVANIIAEKRDRLAIYFHGGLVPYASGMESAEILNGTMGSDEVYPLSFIWKTGMGETLRDNFTEIQETKLFKKLLKYVVKKAGSKLGMDIGAKGAGRITDEDIELEMQKSVPFEGMMVHEGARSELANIHTNEQGIADEMYAELEEDLAVDDEFMTMLQNIDADRDRVDIEKLDNYEKSEEGAKGIFSLVKIIKSIVKIAIRVIKRFVTGRDHEPYATIFEEILRELYIADLGAWIWNGMKEKADKMWFDNSGLTGNDLHVGTYFLSQLNAAVEAPLKIDLVGHSAGSIVICHLLRTLESHFENLSVGKVIFMAPACRADLFHKEVIQHQDRFESFRMFTMEDEHELKDALVNGFPKLYPSSLLYLIAGILESTVVENEKESSFDEPILGMERYIARPFYQDIYPILTDIKEFMEASNHMVLSPTNGNPIGFNSTALDHGGFNEDAPTLESIKEILNPTVS